jgi:hypothetical protein
MVPGPFHFQYIYIHFSFVGFLYIIYKAMFDVYFAN